MGKNLPAMQETQVWYLGQEDPLEKGMTIHSSILVWEIPWIEDPGGLQFTGSQRVRHDWVINTLKFSVLIFSFTISIYLKFLPPRLLLLLGMVSGSWFCILFFFVISSHHHVIFLALLVWKQVKFLKKFFFSFLGGAILCSLWDLSSLTRDWT